MSYPDTITRLESQIAQLEAARMEEARERDRLRSEVEKWHRVAMQAGAVTCQGGGHIYPLRDRVKKLENTLAGLWSCTGCGSMKSIEQIRTEHPEAIACCPERKMAPVSPSQSETP